MNSSKKLIYIANLRLPTEKAYGIQIAKMCEAFALEVELIAPYRKNKIKDNFFDYYFVKRNFKFRKIWAPDFYLPGKLDKVAVNIKGLVSALFLSFYVITQKVDVIYSRDEWPLYFLSFFRKNLVFEAHHFSKSRKLFYGRFKKIGIKVIVISNGLKKDFISFGFPEDKLLLAPDGVDLAEFNIDISKEEARVRMGLPLDRKMVVYTGHLFEWKGAGVLLEAARQCGDVLFVFVGGTEYNVEKFRQKAKDMDLKNVLILGHKPHKDIPFFLKAADILVLPNSAKEEISRSYTSPLKLFEYMVSGRPIISSNLPSIGEILNENNSLFVEPDNDQQLTEAIKKVINDPAISNQLTQKAFEDVKNYTWVNRALKILNFI